MNHLKKQLNTEYKEEAEDCIEIYNWIKSTDKDGCVWSSRWAPLVDVKFKGFPSNDRTHRPNVTGYTLLEGIRQKSQT